MDVVQHCCCDSQGAFNLDQSIHVDTGPHQHVLSRHLQHFRLCRLTYSLTVQRDPASPTLTYLPQKQHLATKHSCAALVPCQHSCLVRADSFTYLFMYVRVPVSTVWTPHEAMRRHCRRWSVRAYTTHKRLANIRCQSRRSTRCMACTATRPHPTSW
jgi:hypothetical protein